MAKLGNIYDALGDRDATGNADDRRGHGARAGGRGDDLRVTVDVPRGALQSGDPFYAEVPLTLGGQRRADPHGDGARVPLNLPANLATHHPGGATLRLRGLGALGPGDPEREGIKRAGDLYITVKLTDASWTPAPRGEPGQREPGQREPAWLPWAIGAGFVVLLVVLIVAFG